MTNLITLSEKNFKWVKRGWYTPMTSPIVPIFNKSHNPLSKNAL